MLKVTIPVNLLAENVRDTSFRELSLPLDPERYLAAQELWHPKINVTLDQLKIYS